MVRAPRSHRGGRRFKSFIAHHADGTMAIGAVLPGRQAPRWRNGRRAAFRAQCPYGCVGSNPSLGTINRSSCACSSADRALPCGGRGRGFESRQAHHSYVYYRLFIPWTITSQAQSDGPRRSVSSPERTSGSFGGLCPPHKCRLSSRYRPDGRFRRCVPWLANCRPSPIC